MFARCHPIVAVAALIGSILLTGCKVTAPIHSWVPPQLDSVVGKRIVISEVVGPQDISEPIVEQLVRLAPQDNGRQTMIAHSSQLHYNEEIRLVSGADQELSDIALSAAARNEGFDYMLRGEVLRDSRANRTETGDRRLTVSWRLTPLNEDGSTGGMPVVVTRKDAIDRYPDLAFIADEDTVLTTAAVRDTYRLVTPSIDRNKIELAVPWLMPGSKAVRNGNVAAMNGRWGEAKNIWNEIASKHPLQVAAVHNLALASVASQDFSKAKELARQAVRRQPTPLYKQTLRTIELMQRDYHKAFGLPAPPEGWYLTQE